MSEGQTVVGAGTLALVLLAGASTLAAQTGRSAFHGYERLVPAQAVAFVGVDDVQALADGFASSPWSDLLADADCADLRAWIERVVQANDATMIALRSCLQGAAAFALVLDEPAGDDLEFLQDPRFSVLFLAGLAGDHSALDRAIRAYASSQSDPDRVVMGHEIGRWHVWEAHESRADRQDLVSRAVVAGDLFVLEGAVGGGNQTIPVLARLGSPDAAGSLAELPRFASSLAARPGGVHLWLDFGRVRSAAQLVTDSLGAFDTSRGRWLEEFVPRSGLGGLEDLSACLAIDGAGTRLDLAVRWPEGGCVREALQCLWAPGDLDPRLAAFPPDVTSVSAWRLDLPRLFDLVMRELIVADVVEPADLASTLASFEESTGMSLRDELLEALSGELVLANRHVASPEQLPKFPPLPYELVILIGLRDGAGFGPLLDQLVRSHGLHAARQRFEIDGRESFRVPISFGPLFSFSIDYAVLSDVLIVSPNPDLFRETIRRYSGAGAGLPRFAEGAGVTARVSKRGGYFDQSRTSRWAHEVTKVILPRVAPEATVPALEVFEEHLAGIIGYAVTVDETGLQLAVTAP